MREAIRSAPELEAEELDAAQRELLRAQRSALLGLRQDGIISDEVLEAPSAEVDNRLITGDFDLNASDGGQAAKGPDGES